MSFSASKSELQAMMDEATEATATTAEVRGQKSQRIDVERCLAQTVKRDVILDLVEKAVASGQTISLLAGVGDKHGVLLRSSADHDSLRAEKRAVSLMLPVLAAVMGGEQQLFDGLKNTRAFSVATKSDRRALRVQGKNAAVQKIAKPLNLAHMLAFGGLLLSKQQLNTLRSLESHQLIGSDVEHKEIARKRVSVGDGVLGPNLSAVNHEKLQQFVDMIQLDIGQLVERAVADKKWPAQGSARLLNARSLVSRFLQWLFDLGAFRVDCPAAIDVFVRFADDFGHLERWSIAKLPLFVQTLSILPDTAFFVSGHDYAIGEPLVWLFASEADTIATVQHYGSNLIAAIDSLRLPISLHDENGEIAVTVSCRVGCSAFAQLMEVLSSLLLALATFASIKSHRVTV